MSIFNKLKSIIMMRFETHTKILRCGYKIVYLVAKTQVSNSIIVRCMGKIPFWVICLILDEKIYPILVLAQKDDDVPRLKPMNRHAKTALRKLIIKVLLGDKIISADEYLLLLSKAEPSPQAQYQLIHRFQAAGRLDLARAGLIKLAEEMISDFPRSTQLRIFRDLGVACFLLGKNDEANHYWEMAGKIRRTLFKPNTPRQYRILGSGWFAAIGHVAMLDFYLKYKKLYGNNSERIVAQWNFSTVPGSDLLYKFSSLGISLLQPGALENDYNNWAIYNDAPQWQKLTEDERTALIDDFWEFEFPDGRILGYTHAAARIQKEWERQHLPPLLSITQVEKEWLNSFLRSLGLPLDKWYVCLHVREANYHKQWNSIYPTMRDANIEDYFPAIEEIVNAGGWVLRMGDSGMKPLPPMKNVIDYAHSNFKSPLADIIITLGCRFFLGTNSGYATVPIIYGVPCALTNWIPIGWPLWQSKSIIMPKLFREKSTKRFLTLEEIFNKGMAFIQNWSDLPSDIELVPNSSEDIRLFTLEILESFSMDGKLVEKLGTTNLIQDHYTHLATKHGTYIGSKLSASFVKNHIELFSPSTEGNDQCSNLLKPSKSSMLVTSN